MEKTKNFNNASLHEVIRIVSESTDSSLRNLKKLIEFEEKERIKKERRNELETTYTNGTKIIIRQGKKFEGMRTEKSLLLYVYENENFISVVSFADILKLAKEVNK